MTRQLKSVSRFDDAESSRARGRAGEDAGVEWLEKQGYELVERNLFTRVGEIDAIAYDADGETLCFVEIKARRDQRFGSPLEAVHRRKQRQIARVAALFLTQFEHFGPCRFDVLGMELDETGKWRYQLIQNAFEAPAGT